jgi:hypothetical protein
MDSIQRMIGGEGRGERLAVAGLVAVYAIGKLGGE